MWNTVFALALALSVWFSAANLAIQLNKDRAAVSAFIEGRRQGPEMGYRQVSSTEVGSATAGID